MHRHFRSAVSLVAFALVAAALVLPPPARGDGHQPRVDDEDIRSGPVKPADLSGAEAERVYDELKDDMVQRYRLSRLPAAAAYQGWTRYNRVPYRGAGHGRRFLNNYANEIARAYGRFEEAGRLPVGSVVAKDSIAVTDEGMASPGPLFLMEKMEGGFNYVSGDWRYTMIMPDGSVFGTTKGEGARRVEFCIACHLAVESQDHLHFFPEPFRRP